MSSEVAIQARGLSKSYRSYESPRDRLWQLLRPHSGHGTEFAAVRDVDLEVHRGETVGIVGRNGSGKSTLLQLVCGTLEPSAGELTVSGRIAPILSLGAGFNPEFTGRENAIMNAAVLGFDDAETEARIGSVEAFAELGEFFDRPVRIYSSGMIARLGFAVAVHSDPEILVIDEVLSVGDEAFARKCFGRIEEIRNAGATILFVSHSAQHVIELCDRALLMEGGTRLLTADPKTVVGFYQRLLYASPEKRPEVLEQIRAHEASLDGGAGDGEAGAAAAALSESSPCEMSGDASTGRFDPELVARSTVEYGAHSARITNPRILAPDDEQVNVLKAGLQYRYAYEVEFSDEAFGVRFGMMTKLVTGFELAGQVTHPKREGIEHVSPGSHFEVVFHFRAALVPDTYFMNAGVSAWIDGSEVHLHRILDAVMFRVESEGPGRVTGWADLTSTPARVVTLR